MQDVHGILLYCNTDVVIIKPVTGRASIRSTSVKQEDYIASGFHTEIYCSVLCLLCEQELDHWNVNVDKLVFPYAIY